MAVIKAGMLLVDTFNPSFYFAQGQATAPVITAVYARLLRPYFSNSLSCEPRNRGC